MQRKPMVYLLLLAALTIWGIIIYRLFFIIAPSEMVQSEIERVEVSQNVPAKVDTFSLIVDYRDPFLENGIKFRKKTKPVSQKVLRKKPDDLKRWPKIAYNGMVKNKNEQQIRAILTLDGQELILKKGESAGGVYVKEIYTDSIAFQLVGTDQIKVIRKLN